LSTMHIDGERIGQACADHIAEQLRDVASQASSRVGQVVMQPRLLWRGRDALEQKNNDDIGISPL
jgi:hypothetical protein